MTKFLSILYVHGYHGSCVGHTATLLQEMLCKMQDSIDFEFTLHAIQLSDDLSKLDDNIELVNKAIKDYNVNVAFGHSLGTYELLRAVKGPVKVLFNPVLNPAKSIKVIEKNAIVTAKPIQVKDFDAEDRNSIYAFVGKLDKIASKESIVRQLTDNIKVINEGHEVSWTVYPYIKEIIDNIHSYDSRDRKIW